MRGAVCFAVRFLVLLMFACPLLLPVLTSAMHTLWEGNNATTWWCHPHRNEWLVHRTKSWYSSDSRCMRTRPWWHHPFIPLTVEFLTSPQRPQTGHGKPHASREWPLPWRRYVDSTPEVGEAQRHVFKSELLSCFYRIEQEIDTDSTSLFNCWVRQKTHATVDSYLA